jgi:hypothetical protein
LGNAAIAGIQAENARSATKPAQAAIEINLGSPLLEVSDLNMPLAPVSLVPSDYIVQQDGTSGLPHGTVTVEPLQILSEGDGTAANPTGNDDENLSIWASKYGMAAPPDTNDEALLNGYRQSMGAAVGQQWAAWGDLYASTNSPDLSVGTSPDQGFLGDVEGAWKAWQD